MIFYKISPVSFPSECHTTFQIKGRRGTKKACRTLCPPSEYSSSMMRETNLDTRSYSLFRGYSKGNNGLLVLLELCSVPQPLPHTCQNLLLSFLPGLLQNNPFCFSLTAGISNCSTYWQGGPSQLQSTSTEQIKHSQLQPQC